MYSLSLGKGFNLGGEQSTGHIGALSLYQTLPKLFEEGDMNKVNIYDFNNNKKCQCEI